MNSKLAAYFLFVMTIMLTVTIWASWHENVMSGGYRLLKEPWGVATLADAYFGFFTFYLWVAYKESSFAKKLLWLILILTLGNIAMALYALLQIRKTKEASFESIFFRAS